MTRWKARSGALAAAVLLAVFLAATSTRIGSVPPVGTLLDPVDGLYHNARAIAHTTDDHFGMVGLDDSVTVIMDDRGVPHIFATSTLDAVRAMGYVVARDRLFQMDFIARVASGRLSELLGPGALETDRFLRRTGMDYGAKLNADRIVSEAGIEADLINAYCDGVNLYIDNLRSKDLPFEYRLLGGEPNRCDALQVARLVQYMVFDLSYRSDDVDYGKIRQRLSEEDYDLLYPENSHLYVPIVGAIGTHQSPRFSLPESATVPGGLIGRLTTRATISSAEGFVQGKGSNNWAVSGLRSTTGFPILAGDMHLALTLPAVWYEVHLITPEMNTYGVTIPGAPLPVEAFNDHLGWTFTNTGSDQIDHYLLSLNAAGTHYDFANTWRPLEFVSDTIAVAGSGPIVDTLVYSHWGPVVIEEDQAVAIQWVAHKPNQVLRALYHMNRAGTYADFERALRYWDSPMQNILYAGGDGIVAIRSTGHLPIRRGGHGKGLLDGSSTDGEWIGRVPFEELPHEIAPANGYATSTNQQPATPAYPHYLGHDWRSSYRSLRAAELLESRERHSPDDLAAYQADIVAMQHRLFQPLIENVSDLSEGAERIVSMLGEWNGETGVDAPEPLILDELLESIERLTWDEEVFNGVPKPTDVTLYHLLSAHPESKWFDRTDTPETECAEDILRMALEKTAETLLGQYGKDVQEWKWGDHHQVIFRHLIGSDALAALGRGPVPFPGFTATLSPAAERLTTHSASWRVVVDFSTSPPVARGIYPGGQSGNPFHPLYDLHLEDYLDFELYQLENSPDRSSYDKRGYRVIRMSPES